MKLFAVILASIAAIAATAQVYLSWGYLEKLEDRWLHGSVEGRKQVTCSQLISATAKYQRLSESVEEYYSAVLQERTERSSRYQDGEGNEELKERAAIEARAAVLSRFHSAADMIFNYRDEDRLYFSPEENSMLGYETFLELPSDLDNYLSPYEGSSLTSSEEAFRETLAVLRRIGDLHPKIVDVCKPILLG